MSEIAHVIGEHIVSFVVQDLVVRDVIHLECVERAADRLPRFEVGRQTIAVEPEGVIGDDEFV
ncbi:hypothetical protein DOU54_15190 [Agrobacterium sp. MS2]|nr:hypothetical protein DOU54_15190 [Agrobacterium sp. MS2]